MRTETETETIEDHLIRERYITGSRSSGVEGECLGCGPEAGKQLLKGRGLCMTHYQRARRGGYLSDYPRTEVYDMQWVENVLKEIITVHGPVKFQELTEFILDDYSTE